MSKLSHTNEDGEARMVDISEKKPTIRAASASVTVRLNENTFRLVKANQISKGDVLTVAKLAGIQAAKNASSTIPLCHPLVLTHVDLKLTLEEGPHVIRIVSSVKTSGATGVEMEALCACSIAALTVYDMVKSVQKDVIIDDLKLLEKSGGKSGDFHRNNP